MSELKYDDLKLGEKAKEEYLSGKSIEYIKENCPIYLNTKPFLNNLNVTDAVVAGVLSGLGILLVGDTGTGKSQLAKDIYNYYFNGNKKEGGNGIFIKARLDIDIYNEIFTELNINKASRELTETIDSLVFNVDELNRNPTIAQNQFFGLGDGSMDYNGRSIRLGRDGYKLLIATANIGNGEFQGTFETDKALYNRMPISIDFDHEMYKPLEEDEMFIDDLREADPNIKEAPRRDISDKIIEASREISRMTLDLGLEEKAIINYLRFGLDNCREKGKKGKVWPINCQDCKNNKDGKYLSSLIKAPLRRSVNSTVRYAAALDYLSKLKDPKQKTDPVDLMFKAFEVTGAYQMLLNPQILRQEYYDQNPKMMADVAAKLKEDFRKNEDYIIASLEESKKGKVLTKFFAAGDKIGNYEDLSAETKKKVKPIEPFTDKREVGLSWMNNLIKFKLKDKK